MANKFVVCAACHGTLRIERGDKLHCAICNETRGGVIRKGNDRILSSFSIGDIGITRAPLRTEA